jgi:hypothetical protein
MDSPEHSLVIERGYPFFRCSRNSETRLQTDALQVELNNGQSGEI